MAEELGSYRNLDGDGVSGSMFNIRTPSGGVKIGPVNLSGEYARQDQKITPQALGISEELVQFMKDKGSPLTDLDKKSSTWNAGIAVYLPGGFLPGFMEEVLRPESFNVSYGRSQFEATNPLGQRFDGSDRSRGIGLTAEILEGMLGKNAPSVGLQYKEPNSQESSISGNITIPIPFQQGGMVEAPLYGDDFWEWLKQRYRGPENQGQYTPSGIESLAFKPKGLPPSLPEAGSLGLGTAPVIGSAAQFGLNAADKGFGDAFSNTLPGRAYEGISSLFSPSPAPPATYGGPVAGPSTMSGSLGSSAPAAAGSFRGLAATPRLPQFAGRSFTPTTLPSGMQGGPAAGAANAGTGASFLGSAASALGGAGSGMFVDSLIGRFGGRVNVGSQVGSAIGGTLGSFLPVPFFGPYLGGFVGGRIGSMFGPGASVGPNGNASLDLKDGVISIDNIGTDNGQDSAQIRELSEGMLDGINKMSSDGLVKFNKLVGSPSVFKQKTGLRVFDGSPDGKWVPAESGADLMTEMLFYNLVTGNAEVTDPAKLRETVGLMGGSATDRINTILDHQEAGTFEPATTQAMRKSDQINTGLSQTKPEGFARSGIGRATKNAVENFPGAGSYITQDDMRKSWNRTRGLLEGAPLRHPSLSEQRTDPAQRLTADKVLGNKLRSRLGGRGRTRSRTPYKE